ncbi:hypothetical protein QO003_003094 [Arthrobacter silviterrae]|nr:hypothetical protein [Arthrobacter silviterrae]MDQ0278791.1 hypothetical protein [Arthrobacter silviterrae]
MSLEFQDSAAANDWLTFTGMLSMLSQPMKSLAGIDFVQFQ